MQDVFVRHDVRQVQATPTVRAATTKEPKQAAGFVFSIWPQSCGANRKFGISHVVMVLHRDHSEKQPNRELTRRERELIPHYCFVCATRGQDLMCRDSLRPGISVPSFREAQCLRLNLFQEWNTRGI